jgi:acyl carrier protein
MADTNDTSDTEITGILREFLGREFPQQAQVIARLTPDSALADLGVLDSLGVLSLATFIEARWKIKVPAKAYKTSFKSLRAAEAAIEGLLAKAR